MISNLKREICIAGRKLPWQTESLILIPQHCEAAQAHKQRRVNQRWQDSEVSWDVLLGKHNHREHSDENLHSSHVKFCLSSSSHQTKIPPKGEEMDCCSINMYVCRSHITQAPFVNLHEWSSSTTFHAAAISWGTVPSFHH